MRFLTSLVLACTALLSLAAAATAESIRIGTTPTTFDAPLLLAKQKGFVEEELRKAGRASTTIEWVSFQAGPPMNEALAAGQIDIVAYGDTPALIGRSAGLQTRAVGIASSGWNSVSLLVRSDSPIHSVAELKGKKVATQKGTTIHQFLITALAEAGIGAQDFDFVNLPMGDLGNVLVKGDVDASAVGEPILTALEQRGGVRLLRDGKGAKNSIVPFVVREAYASGHRAEIGAVLRADRRAAAFLAENRDQAIGILKAEINQPVAVIAGSVAKFDYDPALRPEYLPELKKTEAFLRSQGLTRAAVDVEAFLDDGFASELTTR
ncbi:aliphatic sulfonate ABC transporter substrate-binding protein [Siculibacillus lacustris]|uniref:Putative aliphatic sulfonates-binding protein n=1 Tax=Siculibacillus lacustris TaxID=1549641 RepID=A0A4Q9VLJ0_9HYPH|nr:aliphatic sulfonate ABC transporter substrate-binding protein [Siculibacillus lacustris]TBW36261.1 aliphatic sulfonate ABC transporter substrate-binding protein [Siculibacillus lacustris]